MKKNKMNNTGAGMHTVMAGICVNSANESQPPAGGWMEFEESFIRLLSGAEHDNTEAGYAETLEQLAC